MAKDEEVEWRRILIQDNLDLFQVYLNTIGTYDYSEESGLLDVELGFTDVHLEPSCLQTFQDLSYILLIFLKGVTINQDIIQIN